MSASSNTTTGALPPSSRCTRLSSAAALAATSMPARTDPVTDTIAGVSCSTIARPVSRSPQITLNTPGGRNSAAISASSTVDRRRGVARLEHHRVAGGDAPARTSRPPSSSGSSTGATWAHTPTGSRRIIEVMLRHVLAGALALEVAGGGGEEADLVDHRRDLLARVSAPACRCSRPRAAISSSARASTASAIRNSASDRSEGVVSRQSSNAVAAASIAASTSAGPDSGASAYCSPVDRVDHRRGRAVVGIDHLSVDEVAEGLHGRRLYQTGGRSPAYARAYACRPWQ